MVGLLETMLAQAHAGQQQRPSTHEFSSGKQLEPASTGTPSPHPHTALSIQAPCLTCL